jgi:hypothetical protein
LYNDVSGDTIVIDNNDDGNGFWDDKVIMATVSGMIE